MIRMIFFRNSFFFTTTWLGVFVIENKKWSQTRVYADFRLPNHYLINKFRGDRIQRAECIPDAVFFSISKELSVVQLHRGVDCVD